MLLAIGGNACRAQEGLLDLWVLRDDGITVFVERDPYRLTIWSDGERRLRSLGSGAQDGYGALAYTTGSLDWSSGFGPGWTSLEPDLDPWQDSFVVVQAEQQEGELELVLVAAPDREAWVPSDTGEPPMPEVHLSLEVEPSQLSVRARLEGAPEPRAWSVAFVAPEEEGYLGLGERFNRTNQRGVDVVSWAEEGGIGAGEGTEPGPDNPSPSGEAMTYYPVPFLLSTQGYGFWLDSTWWNELQLATDDPEAWRAWHIGPELEYRVYLPLVDDPRPWPYHLIDQFTATTGRPIIPPTWAFGPRRHIGRNDQVDGVDEITLMRSADLAITAVDDAVHFLPEGSHVGIEEELAAWTARARHLGYRVNAYYNAYFSDDPASPLADLVQEGVEEGHFLLNEQGEPSTVWFISGELVSVYTTDFTLAAATTWYAETLQWAIDLGYNGFMLDFGEYVQPESVSGAGLLGEELHNLYPVLYQRAVSLALENSELAGDWLFFSRSGYTGSSAWAPFTWSGDPAASFESSDGLPSVVRAAINLGVSGAPHSGSDIGGFHCIADGSSAADGELLTRWIQAAAMTSNMQDQSACVGNLEEGNKATLWSSEDAQAAWQTYARLHTRLFPYLFELAIEARETGAPTVRHLFLDHPDRPDLADVDDAWYFGPSLLVAPVLRRGARHRTVPLPPGWFLDWRSAELYEGDRSIEVDAPLAELPLFLRAGGLIPMLDRSIDTLASEVHPDVVGPADVGDVYDVVGLLEPDAEPVSFEHWAGGEFRARYDGALDPSNLEPVVEAAELSVCEDCYRLEEGEGFTRLRVSSSAERIDLGGLILEHSVPRRLRWDLYLITP